MADDLMTDDEQLDSIKRWMAQNGPWVAGSVILAAAFVIGWRYYDGRKNTQSLSAASRFDELSTAVDKHDTNKALSLAGTLAKDFGGSPYADQAELMAARLAVDAGELANAVEPLTRVMNSSHDEELRHIARLRLARVLIDQKKGAEALTLLANPSSRVFGARYHELRGDAYYAMNDAPKALQEYQAALADPDSRGLERGLLEVKTTDLGGVLPLVASTTSPTPAPPAAAQSPQGAK